MTTVYEQELSIYFPEKTGKQYWELFGKIQQALDDKYAQLRTLYGIDTPETYDPEAYRLIDITIKNMGLEELLGEHIVCQYIN